MQAHSTPSTNTTTNAAPCQDLATSFCTILSTWYTRRSATQRKLLISPPSNLTFMLSYPTQPYPADAYTNYPPNRPISGIVLHHSAGTSLVPPERGRSWHFMIDSSSQATIYQTIPIRFAAHHVANTDRWRPDWVAKPPRPLTSDMNYCSIGIEIVYAPQPPYNQVPSAMQVRRAAELIDDIYSSFPYLPIVGHGEVDTTKWPTEPHLFPWDEYFTPRDPKLGRFLLPLDESQPMPSPISVSDFKAYLEQLGTQVNPDTAIFKRAHLAYERGETRGPAISDEYSATSPPPQSVPQIRQRFTAGTAYYDPATGACDWVEVNIDSN